MGEEKTTNNYIIATIAFLLVLTSFHVFTTVYHETSKKEFNFSMEASKMIFKLEEQAALITNMINSFALNPKFPFLQNTLANSMKMIDIEF